MSGDPFDKFLEQCITESRIVDTFPGSKVHPSYRSNGDGTHSSYPPCSCGCTAFDLSGDTPVCLACSVNRENLHVYGEALDGALEYLVSLEPSLVGENRRELRMRAEFWLIHLAKLLLNTADER